MDAPTCASCAHATHDYPGTERIVWCRWWEHATEPDGACSHHLAVEPWDGPTALDGLEDGR